MYKEKNPPNNETYTLVALIGSRVLKRDILFLREIFILKISYLSKYWLDIDTKMLNRVDM